MKDTNFLSIGKLEKNENFEELINSWTKFNENLVICGNGSLKNQLQELILNTNQSNKILIVNPKSFPLETIPLFTDVIFVLCFFERSLSIVSNFRPSFSFAFLVITSVPLS